QRDGADAGADRLRGCVRHARTRRLAVADAVLRPFGLARGPGRNMRSPVAWWRDPWRKPRILIAITVGYLLWSLVPVLIAVLFSLGTTAQVVGLITFQLSYPAVLVRARLATIGRQYEEAAQDLGASQLGSLRRVILPMLAPAIFASTVLVFADVIDDFVIVRYLSGDSATEPVSVKIYNTARAAPTPALNALATILLVAALLAVLLGYAGYR